MFISRTFVYRVQAHLQSTRRLFCVLHLYIGSLFFLTAIAYYLKLYLKSNRKFSYKINFLNFCIILIFCQVISIDYSRQRARITLDTYKDNLKGLKGWHYGDFGAVCNCHLLQFGTFNLWNNCGFLNSHNKLYE